MRSKEVNRMTASVEEVAKEPYFHCQTPNSIRNRSSSRLLQWSLIIFSRAQWDSEMQASLFFSCGMWLWTCGNRKKVVEHTVVSAWLICLRCSRFSGAASKCQPTPTPRASGRMEQRPIRWWPHASSRSKRGARGAPCPVSGIFSALAPAMGYDYLFRSINSRFFAHLLLQTHRWYMDRLWSPQANDQLKHTISFAIYLFIRRS